MERKTLEEQIEISKLTDDECISLLTGNNVWRRIDFWIYRKLHCVWRIIHWNWFNLLEDEEVKDA